MSLQVNRVTSSKHHTDN